MSRQEICSLNPSFLKHRWGWLSSLNRLLSPPLSPSAGFLPRGRGRGRRAVDGWNRAALSLSGDLDLFRSGSLNWNLVQGLWLCWCIVCCYWKHWWQLIGAHVCRQSLVGIWSGISIGILLVFVLLESWVGFGFDWGDYGCVGFLLGGIQTNL